MNEWLIQQGIANPQMGLLLGLAVGGFATVILALLLSRRNAILTTRLSDREQHYQEQIEKLEQAETRLAENFERLAGRIFEERSEKLSTQNTRQLDSLLKPLGEKLTEFRNTVEHAHRQETAQHQVEHVDHQKERKSRLACSPQITSNKQLQRSKRVTQR